MTPYITYHCAWAITMVTFDVPQVIYAHLDNVYITLYTMIIMSLHKAKGFVKLQVMFLA